VTFAFLFLVSFFLSHDLSWGTKGSDSVQAVDLGAIQGVGKHVEVELVSRQQDIDSSYQDALDNIRLKRARVDDDELPRRKEMTEQQQKDIYVSEIQRLAPG
jgi:chitin synthase